MFGANPFFKKYMDMDGGSKLRNEKMIGMPRNMVYTPMDRMRDEELKSVRDKYNNNSAVRVDAHPRFGFKTMLSGSKVPLPTAPAIVGGNVDWTSAKATPATNKLFDTLASVRPMNKLPGIGSFLGLGEPHQQSIHTTL